MRTSIKILIILSVLFVLMPLQKVSAETLDEYMNNLVGPKQQYSTMMSPNYLRNNVTEDYINPQTGELTVAQTDYVLPGRNGLNLEIKRLYKSGISNIYDMKVKYENGILVDYLELNQTSSSFFEDRYNLGIGWRFSFPTIELRNNSDGSNYKFLHTETGDVYKLNGPTLVNGINTYTLENHTVKDIEIKEDSSFNNGQSDGNSKYVMIDKNGKKTYFAGDGRILGIVDRYSNTIKFDYLSLNYYIDDSIYNIHYLKQKKLISRITDSIGRIVNFEYKEGVKNSDGTYTTKYNIPEAQYEVVIYLPDGTDTNPQDLEDNKKIVYHKGANVVTWDSKCVMRTRLYNICDVDNIVKYTLLYECIGFPGPSERGLYFTYLNGTTYKPSNKNLYEDLAQIDYNKSNRIKIFNYGDINQTQYRFVKPLYCGSYSGSMEYRKVIEKQEFDKANNVIKDKVTYKYTGEPEGYYFDLVSQSWKIYPGYDRNNQTFLKDTYKYYVEKTDMKGNLTQYIYNGLNELIEMNETGKEHKITTKTTRDDNKFPKKIDKTIYNVVNGSTTGSSIRKIENFTYDTYGNLTAYTDPQADRDANGIPKDDKHTVKYTYATDKFHILTSKTWKINDTTTSKIEYVVNSLGNIERERKVHLENGQDNTIVTDYLYDTYGNMTQKKVYSTDNTYITNYAYGFDADGIDQKGAYLTKEYRTLNGKDISTQYVYDFYTGNLKAKINGNSKRTDYEYDLFNRVKVITHPDKLTEEYYYADVTYTNREIEYTDRNGQKYLYIYDILDNLVKTCVWYGSNPWNLITQYEYDSNGNKTKEIDSNGNSIQYDYDSANHLIKKSYWDKDTTEKEFISLKYTVGGEGVPLLVTMTDEDGYVKKMYYDIINRLTKTSVTPDKTNFYSTIYENDYVGNKVKITDSRNRETEFNYDDLNRLVKQSDTYSIGKTVQTFFTYNSLNKLLSKVEPGDRVTEYIYDAIGSVDTEKTSKKGSSDYLYKKYTYDGTGNITNLKQGNVINGVDFIALSKTFTINDVNRVTDEYTKIDANRESHIKYEYDGNGNKKIVTEYANAANDKFLKHNYDYNYAGKVTKEEHYVEEPGGVQRGYSLKRFEWDDAGNLMTEKAYTGNNQNNEPQYNITTYLYDYRNRLEHVTQPMGIEGATKTTDYTYTGTGKIKTETITRQGKSCKTIYDYDGLGNMVRKTDAMNNTSRFVYDANGNLIKEIDPRYYSIEEETNNPEIINSKPRIEHEYDLMNRLVKTTAIDGATSTVTGYKEYDERGNVIKDVKGEGYNSDAPEESIGDTYTYNIQDKVTTYTSAATVKYNKDNNGKKTTKKYTYDGLGNMLTEEDANGNVTSYAYYLNGKLKEKVYPDLVKEAYDYDLTGNLEIIKTNRTKNTTRYLMNVFNKPYRIEYPDNTTERFDYNYLGQLTQQYDRKNNTKSFEYDPNNNLLSEKMLFKSDENYDYYRIVKYMYDEADTLLNKETFLNEKPRKAGLQETTVSAGDKVEYTYDDTGKLKSSAGLFGKEIIYDYDKKGNLTLKKFKVSDGYYDIKRFEYDLLSQLQSDITLVESEDIDSEKLPGAEKDKEFPSRVISKISFTYNKDGKLKTQKDANGNITHYDYDLDGRVTGITLPDTNPSAKKYDFNSNLEEETNPKGAKTKYYYNELNQLIRTEADSADGKAVSRYLYDISGNKRKEILPKYYNAELDKPVLVETMPGLSYTYDKMDRLESIVSPGGKVLEFRKYDANGNLEKVVDGLRYNGNIETSLGTITVYDPMNRVVEVKDVLSNSIRKEYDVSGNVIKEIDERKNATTYEYNPDGTLNKVIYPDTGFVEFDYDKLGRKTSQKDQRGYMTYFSYNAFGKLKSEQDEYDGFTDNKYDLNGNLTIIQDKRKNKTYLAYDSNNRLSEKKAPLEYDKNENILYAIESYKYDDLGNIEKKTQTGTKDSLSKRITDYTYYSNGLLETVSDNSGAFTKKYYDKNNNLIRTESLRDKDKNIYDIVKYEYDTMNRMVRSIQLVDENDIYNAVSLPNITNLRDSAYPGKVKLITGYEYDLLGNKTKVIDPRAYGYLMGDLKNREYYATRYQYDILNRVEKVIRKYNGQDVYTQNYYDEAGNITKVRNEKGFFTEKTYDALNRLKTIKDAYQKEILSLDYDLSGNKLSETNPKGKMSYTYDKLNRIETIKDPNDIVVKKNIYDANGNKVKEIDAKGYLSGKTDTARYGTQYTYDLANRLTKVVDAQTALLNDPTKFTSMIEYNQFSQKSKETDGMGNSREYLYDQAGRLLKVIINGLKNETSYLYDLIGNKLSTTDGRGKATSMAYGAFGLLLFVTNPDKQRMSYKYDLVLNQVSMVDRNGNETIYTYDNRNLVLSRNVPATGDSITYGYDEMGNRSSMSDESGISVYEYDWNGRILSIKKNGLLQVGYTYDDVGNILTVTDKTGFVTRYDYDQQSRMDTVQYTHAGVSRKTTYHYDINGNRQSVVYDGGVKEEYTYYKNNRLESVINKRPDGRIISKYQYQYDLAGRESKKIDEYGETSYSYDAAGRISKVEAPGKTSVYTYDGSGNRLSLNETYVSDQYSGYIENGNDLKYRIKASEYIYSDSDRLLVLVENMYNSVGVELIQKRTYYYYDKNGNQTGQTSGYLKVATASNQPSLGTSIQGISDEGKPYDTQLEVKNKVTSGPTFSVSAELETNEPPEGTLGTVNNDASNTRGFSITAESDDAEVTFDSLEQSVSNEFDGFNRLKKNEITKDGKNVVTEYTYDGDDLRTKKVVKKSTSNYAPEITYFIYDRQHVILETDGNGLETVRYIRGINYIARMEASGTHSYFLYNGHGDVVQTVNIKGEVENRYDYDIFGEPILSVEAYACSIRYAGEFYDVETGLYYLRARYYDPSVGRFISEDSYWGEDTNPLSLNLYTYAENDPIRFIDPTGHLAVKVDDKIIDNGKLNAENQDGTVMVDLRGLAEALGGSVEWNGATKVATVKVRDPLRLEYVTKYVSQPSDFVNGKVRVSARKLASDMGYSVDWDGKNVIISSPNKGSTEDNKKGDTNQDKGKNNSQPPKVDPPKAQDMTPETLQQVTDDMMIKSSYMLLDELENLTERYQTQTSPQMPRAISESPDQQRYLQELRAKINYALYLLATNDVVINKTNKDFLLKIVNYIQYNSMVTGQQVRELGQSLRQFEPFKKAFAEMERDRNIHDATKLLSMAVDFIPIVGQAKAIAEYITGEDYFTGEKLEWVDYAIGFIVFAKAGNAVIKNAAKADKELLAIQKEFVAIRKGEKSLADDAVKTINKKTGKETIALCFVSGTLVKCENGLKPIEKIEVGDKVYAEDVSTGKIALKEVKQLFINKNDTLVSIKVKDTKIKTTLSHPFYVHGKGWVEARDLHIGDSLKLASGETTKIESLQVERLDTPVKVYNFEVENWHTYFVSEYSILVHNTGEHPCMEGTPNTEPPKAVENKIITAIKDSKNTIFKTNANGGKVPYGKIVNINDDYKIIVRRDIDEFSHGDANHYNIEVQTKAGNIKYNMHIYVDDSMNIIKVVD